MLNVLFMRVLRLSSWGLLDCDAV